MTNKLLDRARTWSKNAEVIGRIDDIAEAALATLESYHSKDMKRDVLSGILRNVAVSVYQEAFAAGYELGSTPMRDPLKGAFLEDSRSNDEG